MSILGIFRGKAKAQPVIIEHDMEPRIFVGFGDWITPDEATTIEDRIQGPNAKAKIELHLVGNRTVQVTRAQLWEKILKTSKALEDITEVGVDLTSGNSFKGLTKGDFNLLWMAQLFHPDSGVSPDKQARFRSEKGIPDYYRGKDHQNHIVSQELVAA